MPEPHTDNPGQALRQAREARGWTLKELAGFSGITFGAISKYERGVSRPSTQAQEKLAAALELPPESLFPASWQPYNLRENDADSNLAKARKRAGFTHYDLSAISGVPQSNISRYELGQNRPDEKNAGLLAEALGFSAAELFGNDGIRVKQKVVKAPPRPPRRGLSPKRRANMLAITPADSRLRRYRKAAGLRMEDLARLAGVNVKVLQMWETGTVFPEIFSLRALCRATGRRPSELFELPPKPLVRLRIECLLIQDEAARIAGVSRAQYSRYERGLRPVPPAVSGKLILHYKMLQTGVECPSCLQTVQPKRQACPKCGWNLTDLLRRRQLEHFRPLTPQDTGANHPV